MYINYIIVLNASCLKIELVINRIWPLLSV